MRPCLVSRLMLVLFLQALVGILLVSWFFVGIGWVGPQVPGGCLKEDCPTQSWEGGRLKEDCVGAWVAMKYWLPRKIVLCRGGWWCGTEGRLSEAITS